MTHPSIVKARETLARLAAKEPEQQRWRNAHQDQLDLAFAERLRREREARQAEADAEQDAIEQFQADAARYAAQRTADSGVEVVRRQWTGGIEEAEADDADVDRIDRLALIIGEETGKITRQLKLDMQREIEVLRARVERLEKGSV